MVIMYRMSSANKLEYQFVKKALPQWVGMPNLLAERQICPEFLQDAATPEAISDEIIALLLEPERLLRMRADLQQAIQSLGEPGGAARAAAIAVDLVESAESTALKRSQDAGTWRRQRVVQSDTHGYTKIVFRRRCRAKNSLFPSQPDTTHVGPDAAAALVLSPTVSPEVVRRSGMWARSLESCSRAFCSS